MLSASASSILTLSSLSRTHLVISAAVGVVQWNVKVTYEAGDAPKDNKGKDHTQNPDVPQAIQAGTATSSNVSI